MNAIEYTPASTAFSSKLFTEQQRQRAETKGYYLVMTTGGAGIVARPHGKDNRRSVVLFRDLLDLSTWLRRAR